MRRRKIRAMQLKNLVKFVCTMVSISFIVIQIMSTLQLGGISFSAISSTPKANSPKSRISNGAKIGRFGEMVIKMLPENLAFTLFLPSEEAFRRDLRLNQNDSNSHAVLTRVLGFSAVPRWITPADLEYGKERTYQSISGFDLYAAKDSKGMAVINGVVSKEVGLQMKNLMVYVMDGVVMDAEFEQSMEPEDEEEDEHGGGEREKS